VDGERVFKTADYRQQEPRQVKLAGEPPSQRLLKRPPPCQGELTVAVATDGDLLLLWLRLLGWRTELEQTDAIWIGFASRILGQQEVKVRTRATSRSQALLELFEAAVELGAAGSRDLGRAASELVA
jgi:hypothetical protein